MEKIWVVGVFWRIFEKSTIPSRNSFLAISPGEQGTLDLENICNRHLMESPVHNQISLKYML